MKTVFVWTHEHDSGMDYGVHSTMKGAVKRAHEMCSTEGWEEVDMRRFWEITESKSLEEAIEFFNEIEGGISQTQRIEVKEVGVAG